MQIVQVAEWTVHFGGEQPAGSLPKGAATPLPTPVLQADVAFAILKQGEEGGYILEWRGPTSETSGDTWHPSVQAAVEEAERNFGVPPDAWHRLNTGAQG